jgi:transcriptional regulator with XRE-family HTH domain
VGEVGSLLKRRQLGGELRRLRGSRTILEVSQALQRSPAWLSRIERGQEGATLRPSELRELLRIYGVTDEHSVNQLMELLNASTDPDWWERYKGVLPSGLDTFVSLESDARKELAFELAIVPGLLQTETYARAMFAFDRSRSAEATDQLVAMRLERQGALTRETNPLELHAVVDESVLRRVVGGPNVMSDQAVYLASAAEMANVTIQVLPLGAGSHFGMAGAFSVLSFDADLGEEIVYVDSQAGNLYLEKPNDVARFHRGFTELSSAACDPEASIALLKRIAKDYTR